MRNFRKIAACVVMGVGMLLGGTSAWATPTNGTLFYTTFSGGQNVNKVDYNHDGAAAFTLSNKTNIASVNGADGISGNPQDPNSVFVGGQGPRVHRVSRTGSGLISTHATSGPSAFHLEVPDNNTLLATSIPGALVRFPILAGGSLGAAVTIPLAGSDTVLTQVITTPGGDFYTSNSNYGSLAFDTGMASTATLGTTTRIHTGLASAHGGTYDPFSQTVLIFGSNRITQLDLAGAILSDVFVGGQSFDQGTVDGQGHVFIASNGGSLTFLDYSTAAGGLIGGAGNFINTQFLANSLDDVAPLIGAGGTGSTIPEPLSATLSLMGLTTLLGMATRRRAA